MGNQFDRYEYESKPLCGCGYVIGSLACDEWHDANPWSEKHPAEPLDLNTFEKENR